MSSIQALAHDLAAQRHAGRPPERILISLRIHAETHALLVGLSKVTGVPPSALAASILAPGVEEFRTQYLSQLSGEDLAQAQRTIAAQLDGGLAPAAGDEEGDAAGVGLADRSAGRCGCRRQGAK